MVLMPGIRVDPELGGAELLVVDQERLALAAGREIGDHRPRGHQIEAAARECLVGLETRDELDRLDREALLLERAQLIRGPQMAVGREAVQVADAQRRRAGGDGGKTGHGERPAVAAPCSRVRRLQHVHRPMDHPASRSARRAWTAYSCITSSISSALSRLKARSCRSARVRGKGNGTSTSALIRPGRAEMTATREER